MGVIEDLHEKIFAAIHNDKKKLYKKATLTDFVVKNGVDRKKFEEEYNSFSVDTMVRKAKKKQTAYKIQGVPSIVVNGKYLSSGSMSGSYDNLVKILDYLVVKESK
jgi:thiol:disulfide interchange protein DsbA